MRSQAFGDEAQRYSTSRTVLKQLYLKYIKLYVASRCLYLYPYMLSQSLSLSLSLNTV